LLRAAHTGTVNSIKNVDDVCCCCCYNQSTKHTGTKSRGISHPEDNKSCKEPYSIFHDDPTFCLLNAACAVRCPRDYFAFVVQEEFTRWHSNDDTGNDSVNNSSIDRTYTKDATGRYPLHYAVLYASVQSQAYTQYVLETLLQVSPALTASCPDPMYHNKLPLHVLVDGERLMTWHRGGVREVVRAFPNALHTRDPVSSLVPFLASATSATKSLLSLSTTYELLKAAPEMIVQSTTTKVVESSSSFVSGKH
jgi:hypothetical protein